MAKPKEERTHVRISPEEASAKVMRLVEMWFRLKQELKDTASAYKEKIKEVENEIEATISDAEATKRENMSKDS